MSNPPSRPSTQEETEELVPQTPLGRFVTEVLRYGRKGFARIAELSPTRLNVSWVTDDLAVGGAIRTQDIPRLRKMGIRAIADCREEAADDQAVLERNGIAYLRIPTPDAHQLAQADLRTGVAWVQERVASSHKVYIHCKHGVGRAPLLASCFLVSQGASAEEALHLVKARRWQASPNDEQVGALVTFAASHHSTGSNRPTAS